MPINSSLPFLVLHPGAHLGAGGKPGLTRIVQSIDAVFAAIPKVKTRSPSKRPPARARVLATRFEQIAHIIANVREPERLCVCLDTAHVFAAGYDLATEAGAEDVSRIRSHHRVKNNLAALHLNDSKTARGSRVDRHEHIGKGKIGLDAFRFIMRDRRFRKIPKVLETPKGKDLKEDVENMQTLRVIANKRIESVCFGEALADILRNEEEKIALVTGANKGIGSKLRVNSQKKAFACLSARAMKRPDVMRRKKDWRLAPHS